MPNVGLVGLGFMGWIHWLAYQKASGANVTAVCEFDEKKLTGDWRGIQGNFGPPGEQVDLTGISAYRDIDELLADPNVDLVDICLPPNMHADVAIKAFEAGKYVFSEKPLALHPEDCDRIVAAADQAGKPLFVGHVLPFHVEYLHARNLIDSGKYGKLLGGTFKRVISDPKWLKNFYDPDRIGGPMLDLHVHDAHLIRLLFGMPKSVTSTGRMRGEVVEYCNTLFQYDDPSLVVSAVCGVINQQGRGFTHGMELHLEKATLQFEFAAFSDEAELMPLKIVTSDDEVIRPDLGDPNPVCAFEREINEVITSIESGQGSPILSGNLARDAIVLSHRQTESVRSRAPVAV